MKICKRCNIEKPLGDFYKHKKMPDGYLNFCKECKKKEANINYNNNMLNTDFIEKEKIRGREKYKRLSATWSKPSKEVRKNGNNNYRRNYPEKYKAHIASRNLAKGDSSNHLHHWSYNEEHYTDVIEVNIEDHSFIHRYLIYDQERMMYRGMDNKLLDTKEIHLKYINNLRE